jgi:hypothetical protein
LVETLVYLMQKKVKITVAPLWVGVVIVACRQNQQGEKSNKVGRKPLPPELTKTRVATVRLRPHERVLVEQAADARRMTVGEFCESAVIRLLNLPSATLTESMKDASALNVNHP